MAIFVKKATPTKLYRFGSYNDGNASMKDVLGGKGANLAEMGSLGIRVPDGFTIPCAVSIAYTKRLQEGKDTASLMSGLMPLVLDHHSALQEAYGYTPLVSVRSGARVSMPGMMDTILNVGITETTLPEWVTRLGERTALDSYRRLIQMYSSVALEIPMQSFVHILEGIKAESKVKHDSELSISKLTRLIGSYLDLVESAGKQFPQTVEAQIQGAVEAVFESWNNSRAIEYRNIHKIPHDWGTAVNIQSMVFGNMNDNSATGVLFSRNPSNGEKVITGEFLVNAQGEDVVAGIRTPEPLAVMQSWNPSLYKSLQACVNSLESHYKDMQDIEFTVQDGELFILQTRNGKRSALSAFKVAYDMAQEKLITPEVAVSRVNTKQLTSLLTSVIDPSYKGTPLFTGIAAGGGVVSGQVVMNSEDAINCNNPCILVTKETDPDDIGGMNKSVGILTATGGLTSHAAVVARGMNKSCVVGATQMIIESKGFEFGTAELIMAGSIITIDGATGNVYAGAVPLIAGGLTMEASHILAWANAGFSTKLDADATLEGFGLSNITANHITITTALLEDSPALEMAMLYARATKLGELLEQCQPNKIIIDLSGLAQIFSTEDIIATSMFGIDANYWVLSTKVEAINKQWNQDLKNKVIFTQAGELTEALQSNGWKVEKTIMTIQDLLSADGLLKVSEDILTSVFGSQASFEIVRDMVAKEKSITFDSPLASQYWFEALTEKEA